MVLTPSNLHRRLVDLVATHTQLLEIILPSFLTLNLNGESTHDVVVGVGAVGVGTVGVGAVGVGRVGVGGVSVGAVVGGLASNASSHPLAHASCWLSFIKLSSVGQPHLAEPQHLSWNKEEKKEIIKQLMVRAPTKKKHTFSAFDNPPY